MFTKEIKVVNKFSAYGSPARKKPMSRGTGFKAPSARPGLLRVAAVQAKATFPRNRERKPLKLAKPLKSRGMKGRRPSAEEAHFMDAIAQLGCIACKKDGWENPYVSIHHIDGRTKPGAHFLVLPLCSPHHQQDDSDPAQRVSLHGRKATFQARYGTEQELLMECLGMIRNNQSAPAAADAHANNITAEV